MEDRTHHRRLTGYRRLTIRYERRGEHFAGCLHPAAALTCFKKRSTWDKL
ncbi:transposase [Rhodococcus opacus M213]|uniref:Transposase n=1 Tax=Rhodococcus opacus M213 TaxID=1129896 RepID=K8XJ58_RHOOP|nr:transposase [Rhodococcus opacus M213]